MSEQNGLADGLAGLGPFGDKLKATQIICPPHPEGSPKRLRACRNKRGQWWYYQSAKEHPQPDDWGMHRKMTDEEIEDLLLVYNKGQLEARQGPSGCMLLFHSSEQR